MAEKQSAVTFREVLRIREFRALYLAQTLSVIGDQLARIAVAVVVFSRTGSSTLTGMSYAVSYVPWLVGGPTLSVLADRLPRRTVMIVCDLLRGMVVVFVAFSGPCVDILFALVALVALLEPPFAASRAALVPDVVGTRQRYVVASTLGNTTSQVAVVVGFAGGGAMTSWLGPNKTLLLDAVTFIVSALICYWAVGRRPAALTTPTSWHGDMRDGAKVVFGNPNLRWLVTVTWVVVGAVISTEAIAVPYANLDGAHSGEAGVLAAAVPAGVTVGALLLSRVQDEHTLEVLLPWLALLTPVTLAATAVSARTSTTVAIWFAAGGCSSMTVVANRLFVAAVPPEVRGRAFGIAVAGISTSQGVGSLVVGVLARHYGAVRAVETIAIASLAMIVALTFQWKLHLRKCVVPAISAAQS